MITAAFLAILAITLLGAARLTLWLYSNRHRDDWRTDEWWRPK